MASYKYLNFSDHVRSGSCSSSTRGHGYSKAHVSLLKIIHLISTTPPRPKLAEISDFSIDKENLELDLNLRLGLSPEHGESESFAENETDSSAVGLNVRSTANTGIVLEQRELEEEEEEEVGEKSVDVSHVTDSQQHVQVESFDVDPAGSGGSGGQQKNVKRNEEDGDYDDNNERVEAASSISKRQNGKDLGLGCGGGVRSQNSHGDEDGFELLIKAAKLISETKEELDADEEDDDDDEPSREKTGTGRGAKRGNSPTSVNHILGSCVDFEENSPVVKSKRGRNQTLPSRYRDSVLEPLTRSCSGRQPLRLSSTAVSRKRVCRS